MKVRVFKTWERVRSSFWFLPAVMAGGAMVLAFATVALDTLVTDWLALNWGLTFTGGAEGASSLLGAIAGSMITIAGVVFSVTLVALSLTSSQLGPRLLRSFMGLQEIVWVDEAVRRWSAPPGGPRTPCLPLRSRSARFARHVVRFGPPDRRRSIVVVRRFAAALRPRVYRGAAACRDAGGVERRWWRG